MARRTDDATPCTPADGYSERYEERREARGATRAYGPRWTDSMATRMFAALQEDSELANAALEAHTEELLKDERRCVALVAKAAKNRGLSASDQRGAIVQMQHAARALAAAGDDQAATYRAVRAFLHGPRSRSKAARDKLGELKVVPVVAGPRTFQEWLSSSWESEYHHPIGKCHRILDGLERWYPRWLLGTGVVCYERAAGRVWDEREKRGAPVGPHFLSGVVHMHELPTLTSSPGNHYVVVEVGEAPRFMTVPEVARAFMVPDGGPLWEGLMSRVVTAREAVTLIGKGLHVGVARAILRPLVDAGVLSRGMTYGSAFSGIDMFAAAVDAELEGQWRYEFASEGDEKARACLLASWCRRGLEGASCHWDACCEEAVSEAHVTLWVATPDCKEHSPANRGQNEGDQQASLYGSWRALDYVRRARPTVVVVENVTSATVVPQLTALLLRLPGYRVWTAMLDPREVADAPMARERQFWLLLTDAAYAAMPQAHASV